MITKNGQQLPSSQLIGKQVPLQAEPHEDKIADATRAPRFARMAMASHSHMRKHEADYAPAPAAARQNRLDTHGHRPAILTA
jgi:hypothetical protein